MDFAFRYRDANPANFSPLTQEWANYIYHAESYIGGQIIYPLHSATYSSQTCALIDRFGFR